jgi:hypothetical protein
MWWTDGEAYWCPKCIGDPIEEEGVIAVTPLSHYVCDVCFTKIHERKND